MGTGHDEDQDVASKAAAGCGLSFLATKERFMLIECQEQCTGDEQEKQKFDGKVDL